MMKWVSLSSLAITISLFTPALGGHGLIGYGQWWYDPKCCYACRGVITSAPLDCPDGSMGGMDMEMDMTMASPTAPCISENVAFLTTLAFCINSTCQEDHVPTWKIEKYWADQSTGDPSIPPRWTYGATLANITQAPTRIWTSGEVLNYTALLSSSDYESQKSFDNLFDWEERIQSTYVIVIITVGVGTPLLMYLLGRLPYMTGVTDSLKPYLLYPSTIGTYVIRPLPRLSGNAPTMGQGLYIGMFVALNIILSSVSYRKFDQSDPWGFTPSGEIMAYVGYRTGHIAFALLPLTVLFSSRNNILLWLTDWPYSTFLVLHRWVARVCALQAVVHSITLLCAYIPSGIYYTDVHKPYWIWGIVATLCLVLLLLQSVLWFRNKSYEIFLVSHILLSVFAIAGCWYHIMYWKGFTGIYEYWLYAVSAVWFFDRLIRVLRVCKNGIREATIEEIGPDIVRVDIKGLRWISEPGHHVYAYFPKLNPFRPWENHPFSIIHTAMLHSQHHQLLDRNGRNGIENRHNSDMKELEDGVSEPATSNPSEPSPSPSVADAYSGTTMYIKKHAGMTKYLRSHRSLPVLLDGPYRGNANKEILKCDRVLLIGGGIGITGLLAWTDRHFNVKLAWSMKMATEPLMKDLGTALGKVADKVVLVGERLDVNALLAQEVSSGWKRVGVVVCGPGGLCDDVRESVVSFGRREKTVFELEVDAFSW
ncbi:ferric reductase like transmembrane component-domain-containing protein [Annulohypoxylon maeteangense]|uniref:ferric reductase like transmembrane component-domain-containing protein n=1 Tax=Annulohypoxylon maeteangense TaxID=1927788 RepID=UPI0020078A63|nr:ferric reductase like transmembrane component-domain-containing protein [Annulohypoxylon maeteangense]KAI0888490.1 ferric reductase like transmembrane component-domain-containing protein [Annulohypoxylon maeteangense]